MAKLTTKQRNRLPDSDFALPEDREYPVQDRAHAGNAKARATQQEEEGNLSVRKEKKIKRKANMELYGKPTMPAKVERKEKRADDKERRKHKKADDAIERMTKGK